MIDPTGYDAGRKIKGKKRHILVDTQGLLMHAIVHAADVQDRDGGALLMASLFGAFPCRRLAGAELSGRASPAPVMSRIVWTVRDPNDSERIKSHPIPSDILARLGIDVGSGVP